MQRIAHDLQWEGGVRDKTATSGVYLAHRPPVHMRESETGGHPHANMLKSKPLMRHIARLVWF